jgi:uncharacterized protein (TIGR00251 family)
MKSEEKADAFTWKEIDAGVQFVVHVQPRASRNEICGIQGNELKLRLTAPPVDDAANKLCIEFLAGELNVAKSRVAILSGAKSRHKTIKVSGINGEALLSLLGISSVSDSPGP